MPVTYKDDQTPGSLLLATIDNLREGAIHVPFNIRLDKDCGIKAGILQSYKPFRARDANVDQVSILRTKKYVYLDSDSRFHHWETGPLPDLKPTSTTKTILGLVDTGVNPTLPFLKIAFLSAKRALTVLMSSMKMKPPSNGQVFPYLR